MEILFNVISRFSSSKFYNTNSDTFVKKPLKIQFLKKMHSVKSDVYQYIPSDINFEDINFSVSLGFRKGTKRVLHHVNGKFRAGHFIAIVGPSGAGKTTLLDILSGYQTSGVNGTVYNNNTVRNIQEFRKYSSYITCDNHLQLLLTVWENMAIAADLKLGLYVAQEHKDIMIKDVLATLSLDTVANVQARYLSGGQQKRLAIAVELLNNPLVMFFDEPTTGLDSSSSGQCLRLMQKLSKEGKTIICTIHQASASALQLFDEIYILGEGHCLYHGTAENVVEFLKTINITCPMYHNPVDYVIELASSENKSENITMMTNKIENGKCDNWIQPSKPHLANTDEGHSTHANYQRASLRHQFKILAARSLLNCKRNRKMLYMRILATLIISFLCSTLYWQIGNHGGKVRNNYNLLFCMIIHNMSTTIMLGILSISSEISTITNEYFNKRYSLKMYFAATTLCDMPILIFCCLLFTAIVYPTTGQPSELFRIAMFTVISLQIVLVSHSFGLMIGTTFNVMNGTFVGFAFCACLILLAGIGEDLKNIPIIIYWFSNVCFTKYGLEGIVNSIYGYDRKTLACPDDFYCVYKYPKKFLSDIMVQVDVFWLDVLILTCIFIVFELVAFFVLKWRVAKQKHS